MSGKYGFGHPASITLATFLGRLVERADVVVGPLAGRMRLSFCERPGKVLEVETDDVVVELYCDQSACGGGWEWVLRDHAARVRAHSNAGYCGKADALRDALMFAEYGQWRDS